jgi:hypothetical protein
MFRKLLRSFAVALAAFVNLLLVGCGAGRSAKPAAGGPMPLYITPYYNFNGPQVAVGEHSKRLKDADATSIKQLAAELKNEREQLRPEVMYVTAIRLYDLGHKDEAVYWFYTAQYRARLFTAILDKEETRSIGSDAFELKQAYSAFHQLAGGYINGYAFGELDKLEKTLTQVVEEGKSLPKYGKLYPKVKFIPEDAWPEKNREVSRGLSELIGYAKTNAGWIKEQRKKSGIEGKY